MSADHPTSSQRYAARELEPLSSRASPMVLCAAVWAWGALRLTRRRLRHGGFQATVPAPPPLPWSSRRGVYGVLNRLSPTCLERAYVQQRWLSGHGMDFDVVVGVRRADDGAIAAHAWIQEITPASVSRPYIVIHRVPAPA